MIELLRAVQNGVKFPTTVTENDYNKWKSYYNMLNHDPFSFFSKDSMAMIGFVGFCCSYGGKFWGGYARGNNKGGTPRNFADEQSRNLEKRTTLLKHVDFMYCNYDKLYIPPNSIIYADPPYKNTTGYKVEKFDHDEFWEWCRKKRQEGHTIYVSEYEAPDDFECVWSKEIVSGLDKNTGGKRGVEKLFTLQ